MATRRGLTYKPSDIRKNGVRVLRSSNIAEDSFVLSDEDVFVVREAVNIDCVRANDILITAANGSSRLVGKHTIISGIPEESAVHGGFMLLGTTKEPHFVNASMGSSWYRRFIELFVAGGNGAIGNLNKNDLDNQDIAIPSEKEQKKIGSFFRQLDNLITLHQRQPFLHSTPEISLTVQLIHPFYTSSWEQRKVSELFRVTRGYVLAATQTETTKTDEKPYPVYSSQTKDKGLMGYYKDYLYEDAITWTTDGANAGTVNYRAGKFYCTNVCGVLLSNEVKANQMIAEALNSVAKGYVSYVGNPKLMNNVMADIVIQIPTQAEEREQLSSFFAKLDNLITLHQRKGKAAVTGCSNDANNSKGVYCKARDFGYKCCKKVESP